MFTKTEVTNTYNRLYSQFFKRLDDESEKICGERYTEVHKWRSIHDVLFLPTINKNYRILEIGPSITSVMLKQLTGATVEALCIDTLNRNFLDPFSIPLHLCDISRDTPPLPSESFDIILFCEVLEHFIIAPDKALGTILSLLKPGKYILFSVPNFASIQKRVQLLFGKNPQNLLADDIPYYTHLREPVYGEAKHWWEKAGASIVREGFTNYDKSYPEGIFSKLFWTARFLKILNWYGLVQIWLPKTRQYFYFLLTKK
jgi:SAM-dependent methyltransferase